MSSCATKTIFLLDHSQWMREGSGIQVEIDWGNASGSSSGRGSSNRYYPSFIPPVTKSLWTCAIETVMEYARVVTDLFANERLLRFGLCLGQGNHVTWLNNWEVLSERDGVQQQSINFIAEKLGNAGPPMMPSLPHAKSTVSALNAMQIGIKAAIEALAQPTPAQLAFMEGHGKSSLKAINKGRVIYVTTLTPQSVGKGVSGTPEEFFASAIDEHNRSIAPASDHLLPILECEFVILSIHPLGKQKFAVIPPSPLHEVPPVLKCETHVVDAESVVQVMMDLCVSHHELVSTVVTGIPMKEEQNAQHSSNYDVKLWHPRMLTASFDSQVLKWSSPLTPKSTGMVILHCTSAVRITPVDVNGRPTTCLTSFLMNGRSVWLEVAKKGAGKTTSHLLTSHGGEMWLHVIETARNVLEDPPSISEGVGGRVTDYRIPDFADFIRMNTVCPFPKNYTEHIAKPEGLERDGESPFVRRRSSADDPNAKKPLEMSKERLVRKTSYWPMTISGSVLFPMAVHIDSLLKLMPQDKMTDLEKVDCDKCIWSLMSVEARGEPPVPSGYHKKGHKREEQWRSVYNELEAFIRANQHSENHKKVLECFLESRRAESKIDSRSEEKGKKSSQPNQIDLEKALAALAGFGTNSTAITDTPMSPPPEPSTGKVKSPAESTIQSQGPPTLLALWAAKTEKKNLRVLTNTKLYSHLAAYSSGNGEPEEAGTKTNGRKIDAAKS